jgi:hypothetical protein
MSTSTRIGIGAGWLGGAIAGSMLDAGVVKPQDLAFSYQRTRPDCGGSSRWIEVTWMTTPEPCSIIIGNRADQAGFIGFARG